MSMPYRHRQFGSVIVVSLFFGILVTALALLLTHERGALTALVVLTLAQILFSSLTVEVDATALRWAFGVGWLRFSVPLSSIRAVGVVTNPWWYGWGIHLTPDGWLHNVSGTQAVEIELDGGRKLRLGTDEPEALRRAILERLTGDRAAG